jgi:hypothetical protein
VTTDQQEEDPMALNRSKHIDQQLATLIWLEARRTAKAKEAMAADAEKERPSGLRQGRG